MFSDIAAPLKNLKLYRLSRAENVEKLVLGSKILFGAASGALLVFSMVVLFTPFLDSVLIPRVPISTLIDKTRNLSGQSPEQGDVKKPKHDYNLIVSKSFFGSLTQPSVQAQPTPKPAANVTLSLIGTVMTEGEPPYAIIEDSKKSLQDVFEVNSSVFDAAKLKAIYTDRVEIERDGQVEVLTIDESPGKGAPTKDGVASVGNDEYLVDEVELNKALENLPLLLTQARAVPYFKDGQSVGLRLFAIRSGSLYEKIGLMNGDILKGINGSSLADMTEAMKIFERLKEERSINLTLERDKQEKQFRYQIR